MINLQGNIELAVPYKSAAQRARVISEAWVASNAFCLACNSDNLLPTERNTQARDFVCPKCAHPYELKSTRGRFGTRVVDGAYESFVKRLAAGTAPTLLLLEYSQTWQIEGFSAVHRALLSESNIERRKPLAVTARRAGWVGCNILLDGVPPEGRIHIAQESRAHPKPIARRQFTQAETLLKLPLAQRKWSSALLSQIHSLKATTFSLQDVYELVPHFTAMFPGNGHVRAKLRQQLQVLRDAGYLVFLGNGSYRLHARRE